MGLFSSLFGRRKSMPPPAANSAVADEPAEVYRGLRNLALTLRPQSLGLPDDTRLTLAVLMETRYASAVATLACIHGGDASLYLSNGGGVIGGGTHEAVQSAAASFINAAHARADQFHATTEHPLPDRDCVRFYIVTGSGVLTAPQVPSEDLERGSHPLTPLYAEGHRVTAALRERTPDQSGTGRG